MATQRGERRSTRLEIEIGAVRYGRAVSLAALGGVDAIVAREVAQLELLRQPQRLPVMARRAAAAERERARLLIDEILSLRMLALPGLLRILGKAGQVLAEPEVAESEERALGEPSVSGATGGVVAGGVAAGREASPRVGAGAIPAAWSLRLGGAAGAACAVVVASAVRGAALGESAWRGESSDEAGVSAGSEAVVAVWLTSVGSLTALSLCREQGD